ncbi:coatomer subunit alpha-2-like [Mangifera indica]|uniref:coatomer subunit alpha-2-like n=1 Tax=Mangifera indica TaxID=29780 RepID=UPI001CF9BCF0|nr:coatomer subunit alpha-2-like [Mangifera indica]
MLTKFETKSNRVKGLSFHCKRPWILASLHSGVIQMWDYRMGTLVDRFDEHDGPVRSVQFHRSQPLFVSGSDDYKIKVWNYKLHRCLFTLTGHLDYVRTVEFHQEYPWIVSASDDQSIRIWNWQSRTCLSVLTGHNHYVMCALFHPIDDLIVSASLDQTIRVWDIMRLKQLGRMNNDLFGGFDAVVKYVLEGHDRGVNWASFHPTLPLIVSAADDHQVKIWRMNDSKAWEVDTLRGHINNVSCAIFHARQDIIVSNSEDRSIRIWDATKRTCVQTFWREHDRFWILASHPEKNLLAAGHDNGLIVFKLERERPAFSVSGDYMFHVKDRFLRCYKFSTQTDGQVILIRRPATTSLTPVARRLSYNPTENAVLICSDVDGGSYELYTIPKESYGMGEMIQEVKRGMGGSAVFVARNRFAVLDKSCNQVLLKNLKNEIVKRIVLPVIVDVIFYAGTGSLLCRTDDRVFIFDLQQRIILAELQTLFVRDVVWSNDMENVALLCKHSIGIASKKLVHQCILCETVRIKSGAWDENGVFIYTTLNHIKYCLPNGDSGIIRTLDAPVYITKVSRDNIYCLDRDGKNHAIVIDATEYLFKLSLLKKRYDLVMGMIRSSNLCGQAMIAYLKQKGFAEIALHFVKNERTRFNLALESGNIQIAVAAAKEIDEKDYWYQLGIEALRQGNAGIVEYAYQRTRNFERLSFLYLVTGNLDKLSKMLKIAEVKNDVMGQFHNAIYLGDIRERIKILENTGHLSLAYATAAVHGIRDKAESLAAELGDNVPSLPTGKTLSLLKPPSPILCGGDWPLLRVMRGIFAGGLDNVGRNVQEEDEEPAGADWGEDLEFLDVENMSNADINLALEDEEKIEENEAGGWELEDLDLPPMTDTSEASSHANSSVFIAPTPGMPLTQIWTQKTSLAAEHTAAGNFHVAMHLLNRQLGIKNFAPLRPLFLELNMGSQSYLHAFSSAPVISVALSRGGNELASVRGPPALVFKFSQLVEKLKAGYKAFSMKKLPEASQLFLSILHTIPLIVVDSRREVDEVKELITKVKIYVLGLKMELKKMEMKDNPVRQQELATYLTLFDLLLNHSRIALVNATVACYKAGNFSAATSFARRYFETNPTIESQIKICRQILKASEKKTDANQLNYDFRNPFVVCGATYEPIYEGQKDVSCPYCSSKFVPSQKGQLCSVCELAEIGSDASGLLCSSSQIR